MKKCVSFYDASYDQAEFDKEMLATAEQDGLMSAEDKAKLDELAGSSTSEIEATRITQDAEHKFVTEEQITAWDAEKERAEGVEAELQGQIDANVNAITILTDGIDPDKVDGVKDLIDYYETHGTELAGVKDGIAANAKAIEEILNDTTPVDAATVNGFTVEANVPGDAVFTDTVYEHPETHEAEMIVESEEKKFVSAEQIAKIDAIPEDAVFTDTVYEHPETHEIEMIVESEEKKFVSADQIKAWDAKAETTPVTAEQDGLMIAEDKAKLDELYTIPTAPYYDEKDNVVYGCGMGITIEAAEEAGKIKILWADKEGEKHLIAPEGINIYGGGDGEDKPVYYPAASITFNSGLVQYIYGGNRRGSIGNVVIVVNGGSFVPGNGGIIAGGHSAGTRESIVGHAEVVINNTDNEATLVYAGGQGLAVVGMTKLIVNGGSINYVTAGGSHGHTASAEVVVNDGTIKVLQGCNRGTVGNIKTVINGGTVKKLYAGGETEDASVNATYAKAELVLAGGTINKATAGTNGGVESAEKVFGTYAEGVVSDEVAAAMNLVKAVPLKITDIILKDKVLTFMNGEVEVKSIDFSVL